MSAARGKMRSTAAHFPRPVVCGRVGIARLDSTATLAWQGPQLMRALGRSVVAGAAGDALAEQVGVPVMARVLLDHVGDDTAQRPGLARALRRLLAENIQALVFREHPPRRGALPFNGIERLRRVGLIDVVEVRALIGGPVVQIGGPGRCGLTRCPVPLDLGHGQAAGLGGSVEGRPDGST